MTTIAQQTGRTAEMARPASSGVAAATRSRLMSIDALRGMVMAFMLVDHVRETWFLHMQVSDPVDANTTDPGLFFTRLVSIFSAPVFVALTGLGAWLFGQSHSKEETSMFLLKRGLFLVILEPTLVRFAWAGVPLIPGTIWLQVIWVIGVSMIFLAAALHLPRFWQLIVGAAIVCGHNLLDPIQLTPESPFYLLWGVLHQRSALELGGGVTFKVTYPLIPWIGVILLGYWMGPWFAKGSDPATRMRRLMTLGFGMIAAFVVIRLLNVYGDKPWFVVPGDELRTVMSFLALTKYPPSLLFLLPTLGFGALMLAVFEKIPNSRIVPILAVLGGAPMFFYILHLYVLKVLYAGAFAIYGPTKGTLFGVDNVSTVWFWVPFLLVAIYFPTRWFAGLKQRRRDIWWLKYL